MTMLKLQNLRKSKGITQTFMAEKLGFAYPSGYNNIEKGRRKMSLEQAILIAEILKVSVEELADDKEGNSLSA